MNKKRKHTLVIEVTEGETVTVDGKHGRTATCEKHIHGDPAVIVAALAGLLQTDMALAQMLLIAVEKANPKYIQVLETGKAAHPKGD